MILAHCSQRPTKPGNDWDCAMVTSRCMIRKGESSETNLSVQKDESTGIAEILEWRKNFL